LLSGDLAGAECLLCGRPTRPDGEQSVRRRTVWRRCESCGFAQVDPMPASGELEHYYGGEGFRLDIRRADSPDDGPADIERDSMERRLAGWLPHIRDAERWLDVGSGWGLALDLLPRKRRVGEARGVEPGPWGRTHGAWRSLGEAKGPFDLVTCFHVLEHVPDPLAFLRRIRELASGQVCVATPLPGNRAWPHLTEFTVASLGKAMGLAGLPAKIVGMTTELRALHDPVLHG
jgi:hypothetical protein